MNLILVVQLHEHGAYLVCRIQVRQEWNLIEAADRDEMTYIQWLTVRATATSRIFSFVHHSEPLTTRQPQISHDIL